MTQVFQCANTEATLRDFHLQKSEPVCTIITDGAYNPSKYDHEAVTKCMVQGYTDIASH